MFKSSVTARPQSSLDSMIDFHESFRQVEWEVWLEKAEKSIDIMVYFRDKWIISHHHSLTRFLQKPNSKIRIFLADDSNAHVFAEIQRLFPDRLPEELKQKILNTYMPLKNILVQFNLPSTKLEVYKLPHLLNYSFEYIDEKLLILSFFEMYRKDQIDSPAFVIDLKETHLLKKFMQKELLGMKSHGFRIL